MDAPIAYRMPYIRAGDMFKRREGLSAGHLRLGAEEYQQELLAYSLDEDNLDELADRYGNFCLVAPTQDAPCTAEEIAAIRHARPDGGADASFAANAFSELAATSSLRLLRALARHWIAHKEGTPVEAAWEAEGFRVKGERRAWGTWTEWMNAQLRPIAMRVQLFDALAEDDHGDPDVAYATLVAMQIANAIAEDRPVFRCQNETCGRFFTRKRGGAKEGQHWTQNVKYCEKRCADAQAQREGRRRKKLEQASATEPKSEPVGMSTNPAGSRATSDGVANEKKGQG